jgi:hypothetical protein
MRASGEERVFPRLSGAADGPLGLSIAAAIDLACHDRAKGRTTSKTCLT